MTRSPFHRHRHLRHDRGRGLLLGDLPLPLVSILPIPPGGAAGNPATSAGAATLLLPGASIGRKEEEETRKQAGVPCPSRGPQQPEDSP